MGGDLFDVIKPFLFGGISGCVATSVIQPIDTVKVQIQVIGETNAKGGPGALSTNPFQVAQRVIKHEGVRGLYKGNYLSMICNQPPQKNGLLFP